MLSPMMCDERAYDAQDTGSPRTSSSSDVASCVVQNVLTGASMFEFQVSRDTTVADIKAQIASIAKVPRSMQKFLAEDDTVMDDCQCLVGPSSEVVFVRFTRLPLHAACNTPDEWCCSLAALTDLGPDAVGDHVDEIVSALKQPLDFTGSAFDRYFRTSAFGRPTRVFHAAYNALQSLGTLPSYLAPEVAAVLLSLMDEKAASDTVTFVLGRRDRRTEGVFYAVYSSHTDMCVERLSSLLSSTGLDGITVAMESFPSTFQEAGTNQTALAVICIARAMRTTLSPADAQEVPLADWFANFFRGRDLVLQRVAANCLCCLTEALGLHASVEPYIGDLITLLAREESQFLLSSVQCRVTSKVLRSLGAGCAPYVRDVIVAFKKYVSEEKASLELERFRREVCRKSHGGYMFFLKAKHSVVGPFSLIFDSLDCEALSAIMQPDSDVFQGLGPCRKAVALLCAARAVPRCTKPTAAAFASWLTPLLSDPHWQVRACAVLCLQRVMAGNMLPYFDSIAALLKDDTWFVRQLAATALGCLGRKVAPYTRHLLKLLADSRPEVRYASLVTLGGLLAKARPFASTIAARLVDPSERCRMAALRALKCMGHTAEPYVARLEAWQNLWVGKRPESVTTRALLFRSTRLRDLFKGPAPLGHKFAGTKATRDRMREAYSRAMSQKVVECHVESLWPLDPCDVREEREAYVVRQQCFRGASAARRDEKQHQRAPRRACQIQRGRRGGRRDGRRGGRKERGFHECARPDWIILA